jgi:hypothetical protein
VRCFSLVHLRHCSGDSAAELEHEESAGKSAGAAELNVGMTGSAENFHHVLLSETEDSVVHYSGDVYCC